MQLHTIDQATGSHDRASSYELKYEGGKTKWYLTKLQNKQRQTDEILKWTTVNLMITKNDLLLKNCKYSTLFNKRKFGHTPVIMIGN